MIFCRGFAATSIIVTVISLGLIRQLGMEVFGLIFFFKATTLAVTVYFIDVAKKKEYYYYSNLGISKRWLWGTVIAADMLLFIALTVILSLFRHAALN